MKLARIKKERIFEALVLNGSNDKAIERVTRALKGRRRIYIAQGVKFTAILCGDNIGIAKRVTYSDMADDYNEDRAIAIAASRLLATQ